MEPSSGPAENGDGDGDGDPSSASGASSASSHEPPKVVTILPKGDILLDVTFETSKATLQATRRALPKPRPGQRGPPPPPGPILKPHIRLAFRVDLLTLKKHSKYFTNLLGDTRFEEARTIAAAFKGLSLLNESPGALEPNQLPRVAIVDDDEATRSAGREGVFADMLRILHGRDAVTKPVTLLYITTLAVMADRFACTVTVSRSLSAGLKFKWPATPQPKPREGVDGMTGLSVAAEEALRQKVLVSWLLDQPLRFQAATKEMIIYGSHRWSADYYADEAEGDALWWYLPDELEDELHHRRSLILRCLASVQSHFLRLFTTRSPVRQCKLGYDSSSACDSFQLGEMVKFLTSKNLLFLANFSSSSSMFEEVKDFAAVDINAIIAALKQCPNYQVDKNHTNCGLRTRLMPILEYVQSMLSTNVVPVGLVGWKKDRRSTSWVRASEDHDKRGGRGGKVGEKRDFVIGNGVEDGDGDGDGRVFRFTRSLASDQRLRYEGAMAADRMARQLFTADEWDWTPEE